MEYVPTNEQKLIDIMFQIGIMIHEHPSFRKMDREEVAKWISAQLNRCGFVVEPCGSSWGVLTEIH
jgi:hypothetical protein